VRALSLVIGILWVALPIAAEARPKLKIAIAPIQGDAKSQVAQAVADALAGKDFAVIGPREVDREIRKLGMSDALSARDARRLIARLGVVALIDGAVDKPARRRSLHLEVHRHGKPSAGFTVEYKSASSAGFRRAVHDEIAKKLDGATEQDPDHDDDDQAGPALAAGPAAEDAERARKRDADADDAARRAKQDDDRGRDEAGARSKSRDAGSPGRGKRVADDDAASARRGRRGDEDDTGSPRKRRAKRLGAEAPEPAALARAGAGGSLAQRRLSFVTRAGFNQIPPRVITLAGAGRVDGEIYPFAIARPGSGLSGLGLAGAYDKTFGLSIKIPNQSVRAPIDQAHYALGARYRWTLGEASIIAIGLDYARRHYIADRSGLMTLVLDAPDVDYSAIAPGVAARVPVSSSITGFAAADGLLILKTGAIQTQASYGAANVYGFDAQAGVELAVTHQIGVRVAVEYSQINLAFKATGAMATSRDNDPATVDVTAAVDRSIGISATLGLVY
jgi:hypothetical protein